MRPDWGLLASWVAVIEAGSVSDAAHALHVSQAAPSGSGCNGSFGT